MLELPSISDAAVVAAERAGIYMPELRCGEYDLGEHTRPRVLVSAPRRNNSKKDFEKFAMARRHREHAGARALRRTRRQSAAATAAYSVAPNLLPWIDRAAWKSGFIGMGNMPGVFLNPQFAK